MTLHAEFWGIMLPSSNFRTNACTPLPQILSTKSSSHKLHSRLLVLHLYLQSSFLKQDSDDHLTTFTWYISEHQATHFLTWYRLPDTTSGLDDQQDFSQNNSNFQLFLASRLKHLLYSLPSFQRNWSSKASKYIICRLILLLTHHSDSFWLKFLLS